MLETVYLKNPMLRELFTLLVISTVFVIDSIDKKKNPYQKSFWFSVFKKDNKKVEDEESKPKKKKRKRNNRQTAMTEHVILPPQFSESDWEKRQKEKWESWMNEEVNRLNGGKGQAIVDLEQPQEEPSSYEEPDKTRPLKRLQ